MTKSRIISKFFPLGLQRNIFFADLLNVIAGQPKSDRIMYSAIFEPRNNPIGRLGNMFKAMQYTIPPPARRVPKKHRHLLKYLSLLVRRAAKCPFSILLNTHCPLPQQLCRSARVVENGNATSQKMDKEGLEGLMDELYEEESGNMVGTFRSEENQNPKSIFGVENPLSKTSQSSSSQCLPLLRDQRNVIKRRQRRTGLSLLVAEAQSQLPQDSAPLRNGTLPSTIQGTDKVVPENSPAGRTGSFQDVNLNSMPSTQRPSVESTAVLVQQRRIGANIQPYENLATCFVPHNRVTAFVWAVVRRIVPAELLGDRSCRRTLRLTIARFVSLRRYEQMSIHQAMQGLKLSGYKWLGMNTRGGACPSQVAERQRTLALWLGWLFAMIVVPLLRAQFFCTESEAYRQQVFYYRKPVWMHLASSALDGLSGTQFARISAPQAQKILQSRKIGVARLRLLPKRSGMRYIINLSRKSKVTFRSRKKSILTGHAMPPTVLSFPTVNSLLKNVHRVLKLEAIRQPEVLGASLFGYNDVYCRLQPFIKDSRRVNGANHDSGSKPYIVSVDVSRAFDHVDVSILLDIVTPLLQSEQYMILKYSEIVSLVGGDIKVIPRRAAVPMDAVQQGSMPFPEQAAQWALSSKCKVWVDGVVYDKISRTEVLMLLKQHLTANLIRLRKAWHYQCRGIAQGSTLSTLLCCLYLAHVERLCFQPLIAAGPSALELGPVLLPAFASVFSSGSMQRETAQPSHGALTLLARQAGCTSSVARNSRGGQPCPMDSVRSKTSKSLGKESPRISGMVTSTSRGRDNHASHTILLRLIDDWLLITYHKEVAEAVAKCMLGGIPAYNVAINPTKTKLSFPMELANGNCIPPSIYVAGNGSCFVKWCGLLLNTRTLEFQGDYTRYAGEHMSTSFNVPYQRKPGSVLGLKLCHYLRPKLHPLLLDRNINSWSTIRLNIYQAFAVAAMKFHCYVKALSSLPAEGTKVLWEALEVGISFVCKTTRPRRVAPAHHQDFIVKCEPRVSSAHVRYLGMHAFRRVLGRKQSAHAAIIKQLDEALSSHQCVRCAKSLAQVIDTPQSTVLDAIEY